MHSPKVKSIYKHQYIKANIDMAGYRIFIQRRGNRKGGGIVVIYKTHQHVKKLSLEETTSFETITV